MLSRRSLLLALASLSTPAWAGEAPASPEGPQRTTFSSVAPVFVVAGLPIEGNPEAEITLFNFSDFQCPYCIRSHEVMAKLLERFPTEIRYQYRQLPLDFHPGAPIGARYYEAVASIDPAAAVTLKSLIFGDTRSFSRDPAAFLDQQVAALGLDVDRIRTLSKTPEIVESVERDKAIAADRGITGTPSFVISGPKDGEQVSLLVKGAWPSQTFENIVRLFLGQPSTFSWS